MKNFLNMFSHFNFFFLTHRHHTQLTHTVAPMVKAVNQLVGAPVESHVLLECLVEVFPKPLNGWYRNGKIFVNNEFFLQY